MTKGLWNKTTAKTYEHISGTVVRFDCNHSTWAVIGGPANGRSYGTLKVAAYVVEEGLAA